MRAVLALPETKFPLNNFRVTGKPRIFGLPWKTSFEAPLSSETTSKYPE
jgi:hypothetical protein